MEPSRKRYLIDIPGGEEEYIPPAPPSPPPPVSPLPLRPKYLIPFRDASNQAESLFDKFDRRGDKAWLIRFTYLLDPETHPIVREHHIKRLSSFIFAVGVNDLNLTEGWIIWKVSDDGLSVRTGGGDRPFASFDILTESAAAKSERELREFISAMSRTEQEEREEAVRRSRDERTPLTPEDEQWLRSQGYTPYTGEDGLIWWRHPDTGNVMHIPHAAIMRSPRPRRASRRPTRTGLRIHPVPTGYVRGKRKVAFSVPEMANFAYGGLARGGRDVIKRGRNDKLERIPDNYGRGIPESPDTIEVHYKLFGNLIAVLRVEANPDPTQLIFGELELYSAGWRTITTKDRLQTLLDTADIPFYIAQRDWEWYFVPRETGWSTPRENWREWEEGKTFALTFG